ncbi:MAG TPA: hypothetical protein VFO89_00100 [Thermoanaerobaculia bacterium]|nr:hypothetical protein [Thermoanaerobaculia bacterium]
MQPMGEERREFQRLRLGEPLPGTFAATSVSLTEIGVLGARVHHSAPLPAGRGDLRFASTSGEIVMRVEIVRTFEVPGGLASGMRFLAAVGDSGDHLRTLLAELVTRALAEHHDSSATRLRIRPVDGDKTVRGVDAQFLSYRFERGGWQKRHVFLPEQPSAGFTVAKGEDTEEMQRLCAVYEASDDEGRRLIRLFAELSVSEVMQIPPRS